MHTKAHCRPLRYTLTIATATTPAVHRVLYPSSEASAVSFDDNDDVDCAQGPSGLLKGKRYRVATEECSYCGTATLCRQASVGSHLKAFYWRCALGFGSSCRPSQQSAVVVITTLSPKGSSRFYIFSNIGHYIL